MEFKISRCIMIICSHFILAIILLGLKLSLHELSKLTSIHFGLQPSLSFSHSLLLCLSSFSSLFLSLCFFSFLYLFYVSTILLSLSLCLSVRLSLCLSVCLSLSLCLSGCLSLSLPLFIFCLSWLSSSSLFLSICVFFQSVSVLGLSETNNIVVKVNITARNLPNWWNTVNSFKFFNPSSASKVNEWSFQLLISRWKL